MTINQGPLAIALFVSLHDQGQLYGLATLGSSYDQGPLYGAATLDGSYDQGQLYGLATLPLAPLQRRHRPQHETRLVILDS